MILWTLLGGANLMGEVSDPADPIEGRSHWAFRPLHREAPQFDSEWARSPIDRYIWDQLKERAMEPSADAGRETRLRRLYIQLTGLPPSPDAIESFKADSHPTAWRAQVDQLIHSPDFGVRWGRHWLDLARYADSNGLDENFLFREAWRYRNWVIDAVNQDVPYDRFLELQLAGDLLPYQSIEERDWQRIASGFLVVGPKVLLGIPRERQRMEVADEQLDTIGRTVLGMTIGCARCHDHKFDPIPTADYYAMVGILTSTEVMEQRYMLGQQRVMERLVGLGEDGGQLNRAYEAYWRSLPKVKSNRKDAEAGLAFLKKQDASGLKDLVGKNEKAVTRLALDSNKEWDERVVLQEEYLEGLTRTIANPPAIPARAMIPTDRPETRDEAIRRAGQYNRKGPVVPRGFLQVMDSGMGFEGEDKGSGRLSLARWLTDREGGAGHLAARVLANRIWYHLMGRGLVRTLDHFGRTGARPTHPELLDYLASELIASGWSVKHLIREIVLSRAWGLDSVLNPAHAERDPENLWFGRGTRRRNEPEVLRDGMLLIAGELDRTPMESSVWYLGDQATAVGANKNRRRTDFKARSIYLPVIRNDLPEVFEAFDFADPHLTTGARPKTMAATQGLFMMNDPMVMELAERTVERLGETGGEARMDAFYWRIFGRGPTSRERADGLQFVEETRRHLRSIKDEHSERNAWALAVQAMFASSAFQYLD